MRRALKRFLIELTLSVVVTVLVAWTITWTAADPVTASMGMAGVPDFPGGWIEPVPSDWPDKPFGSTYVGLHRSVDSLYRGTRVRLRQGMNDGIGGGPIGTVFLGDDPRYVLDRFDVGWPIQTMTGRGPDDARPRPGTTLGRLYAEGIPIPGMKALGLASGRRLPLRPIWGPFLLATLTTALILEFFWQLWRLPGRVRRRRWRKRGRCLNCGYELGGLERCPECNTPAGEIAGASGSS